MAIFRQKTFSEYDAMRSLYVELMRLGDRNKFTIIDSSSLIPILRGNNIVIEKFTIVNKFIGRDTYRMYLKIGAKAKMPDEVRLPGKYYDEKLGRADFRIGNGVNSPDEFEKTVKDRVNKQLEKERKRLKQKNNSRVSLFSFINMSVSPNINFSQSVKKLLGEAVKYDKKSRSLVLEFREIYEAIQALNILPFGIGYKVYLLDA